MYLHVLLLELFSTLLLLIILLYLFWAGRRESINKQEGWNYILLGFFLVFVGTLLDFGDNFPELNSYFILGKISHKPFFELFERFFGYFLGFFLLAIGLKKWMPTIIKLKELQRELEKSHEELERKIRERTENLLSEIAHRKRVEEKLLASLEERNILLREVHHRVKNNLQIVLSLIGMRLRTIKSASSRAILEDLHQRIMAISLIHESLYKSESITSIDAGIYIENLLNNLYMFYGKDVRIHSEISNTLLSIDIATSVGIILSELVVNALKHAFPHGHGGNIYVHFKDTDDCILLEVWDDGVGLRDKGKDEKLGLKLIGMFLEHLKGSMEMEGGKGTRFKIRIPKVYDIK